MSFQQAVQEQIIHDRSQLIVDNFHAYARIESKVEQLWSALCLLGESKLSKENLLSIYAGIASMAQHAAESLHAVDAESISQDPRDEIISNLREELHRLQMKESGYF
jgi:hypothetical protein